MVHGDCKSVGCYAMTDGGIAEIYALARESFRGGNTSFQVQIFPFRMTAANLAKRTGSPNFDFWKDIKEGYDLFELTKTPPVWDVCQKQYIFNPASSGPLDALGPCPATIQTAGLSDRQRADAAVLDSYASAQQKSAAEDEAIKARGEAVGSFITGIGNMFGGGSGGQDPNIEPVMSGKPAPVPLPRLQRG